MARDHGALLRFYNIADRLIAACSTLINVLTYYDACFYSTCGEWRRREEAVRREGGRGGQKKEIKKEGTARHRERMKKQKARMIIRHAHQKYRFPSRARGYDSGLSCLFPRLCRNDFRQTKSLDRTALQSINARGPSSTSPVVWTGASLLRNNKFLRTDLSRPGSRKPRLRWKRERRWIGFLLIHAIFQQFTSVRFDRISRTI